MCTTVNYNIHPHSISSVDESMFNPHHSLTYFQLKFDKTVLEASREVQHQRGVSRISGLSEIVLTEVMLTHDDPGVLAGEKRGSGSGGRDSGDSLADIQRPAQGPAPDSVSGQLQSRCQCTVSTGERILNISLLLIVSDIGKNGLFLVSGQ